MGPTGGPGPGFPTRTNAVADQYVVVGFFLIKEEAPIDLIMTYRSSRVSTDRKLAESSLLKEQT